MLATGFATDFYSSESEKEREEAAAREADSKNKRQPTSSGNKPAASGPTRQAVPTSLKTPPQKAPPAAPAAPSPRRPVEVSFFIHTVFCFQGVWTTFF